MISLPLRRFYCLSPVPLCVDFIVYHSESMFFPYFLFLGCMYVFLYFLFCGCIGGRGWFSYFCPHEPPQVRSVAQSCPSLCHPMNCLHVWNQILKQRILTPSRWRTKMFYCWRLNVFLIADKPSSELSKVGDFPPSVSFYRGVNSIEQERNALLLGRKRAGST